MMISNYTNALEDSVKSVEMDPTFFKVRLVNCSNVGKVGRQGQRYSM